ncbi:NYN domain-containing protein [Blastomonas sp.]|uniref:NYN domain-containing protein n=1 Tax=Blastomonas sp. TaxID=1909299 RepID=UPI00391C0058
MAKETPPNIALLIDADNASPSGIDPVLTVLAELGTVNIRRAYANWRKPALKGWADIVHKFGIEPQQQFDLTKGKNATDMKMTIDAMDLLFRGRVNGFGIMSSDSDFMPLAQRIRQDGLPVYGFGGDKTPEAFKQACTRFIDVNALIKVQGAEKKADNAAAAKGNGKPDPKPAAGGASIDEGVIQLLIDAYQASKRDERGFASLSEVGKIAGNRSSFDVRNHGFPRLLDMFEASPQFTTERRENGGLFVKRLR